MIRLRALGGLDLEDALGAKHALLSQPKRLALLVYLAAANGHGFRRRDSILPLFWPDLDENRARGALRQAMYVLRRDLGEGVIRSRGEEELGVDTTKLWFDVTALEAALADGRARDAADLYRGEFFEGFFVAGSGVEFDEWVARERDRLRTVAGRAMWAVAEETAGADPTAAAPWIRRAVALAPDDELTVRRALGQLDRMGDRAGALQLYHEFRDRLQREYGAEPATETKAVGDKLRLSRDPVAPVSATAREPSVAVPTVAEPAVIPTPQRPARPRRSARWRAVAATTFVLTIATIVAGVTQWNGGAGSLLALGRLNATDEILVGDISAPAADSLAARALTELLRASLHDSKAIHVVSRDGVDQLLRRMLWPLDKRIDPAIAREMATRGGYEAVLTTELTPIGRGFVLSARLTSTLGAELAEVSESALSVDALIPAVGRLSKQLRARIGESREVLVAIPPLENVTTSSLRALALFTQAQEVARVIGQQPPRVMALLRETLAEDSTFAMAHRRYGAALFNLGLQREALAEFRAAERFSGRLTELEKLLVRVALHSYLREHDRAATEAHEALRIDPGNVNARNQLAFQRLISGQYDLADQEFRQLGFVFGEFWSNLRAFQGRGAEALDSARTKLAHANDSTWSRSRRTARGGLASLHAMQFAYDSAIAYALPSGDSDPGSPLVLAGSHFARGQIAKAIAIQQTRATKPDGELYALDVRSGVESYTAMAIALIANDRASANRRMDAVLADSNFHKGHPANRHIRPILALAVLDRAADARRELKMVEDSLNDDVRIARETDLSLARGVVALSEHRTREAISALTRASTTMTWGSRDSCRACALPWLGRAYESAGMPDSATSVYERYLNIGDPYRLLVDAVWRPTVLRRLGELHAQRGDTTRAVLRLTQFVDLWKDGDALVQPEVDRARRQLALLRPR